MKFIIAFLMFAAGAITSGEALCCHSYDSLKGEPEKSVKCINGEDTCASTIEYNRIDGDLITVVRKMCLKPQATYTCGKYHLLDSECFEMRLYTYCCQGNDCNDGPITMPWKNTTKNGFECGSCFVEDGLTCEEKPKKCVCMESQCLRYTGPAARPGLPIRAYAFSGCVTKGACQVAMDDLLTSKAYNPLGLSCVDA